MKYEWLGPELVVFGQMRGYGAFYEFTDEQAKDMAEKHFIKLPEEEKTEKPAEKKTVKTPRRGRRNG